MPRPSSPTVMTRRSEVELRPHMDAAFAVLVAVLHEIAQDLREIAGVAAEHGVGRHVDGALHTLVAIDLVEHLPQILDDRAHGDGLGAEAGRARRARAAQLIRDALIHALELAVQRFLVGSAERLPFARLAASASPRAASSSCARVVERVAVTREAPPLGIDQRVQVIGEADDLGWIAPGELHALAGFDLADLPLEPLAAAAARTSTSR